MLVAANGFRNSSLIRIRSCGRLSVIVMLPSPTLLFPAHEYFAPIPAAAPSYVFFIAGSSFPHGFHASHLRKSFTCANTTAAGAATVPLRVIRNRSEERRVGKECRSRWSPYH